MLTLKGHRNRYSSKNWEKLKTLLRNVFFSNVFNFTRMFLRLFFQHLILLVRKIIEIITVHENRFGNLFFVVLRLMCEEVLGKNSFFSDFDLI